MEYLAGSFDIIIIGAGHAGIEAALCSARLGQKTLCITSNLDAIGNMPCNPSIGGTAKGQLVREVDALGGEIGRAGDFACIQFRMLNRGKGPAVHSPRAQADRARYREYMKSALENCPGLSILQGECAEIITESNRVAAVRTRSGARYDCKALVVATGTFLNGRTFTGDVQADMGPDGLAACNHLSSSLHALGIPLRRFKTGTPPRIDRRSVDIAKLTPQQGEEGGAFSFYRERKSEQEACYLGYTNENTHAVILRSLSRSPLYSGEISGVGPRYCPSIEDKVVRFSDKDRHQIFLEPCGERSNELYVQGLSTSLPEDVQIELIRTIEGLERAQVMRFGYAIEYDCIDPTMLEHTLQYKGVPGLYFAGQICGSSGYEEAAAQGLLAGINAARFVKGEAPFTLSRADGYIGTLVDDLVLKGTSEPYRMMTSRCEYRLVCRHDNADFRLMERGHALGLVEAWRVLRMREKYRQVRQETERLKKTFLSPSAVNGFLQRLGTAPASSGVSLCELLRRPEVGYQALAEVDEHPIEDPEVIEQVEIEIKYEGYIERMEKEIEEQKKMEDYPLPGDLDYLGMNLLRIEARQKLHQIRPHTLGQAARISGVSPSDIGALMVILSQKGS